MGKVFYSIVALAVGALVARNNPGTPKFDHLPEAIQPYRPIWFVATEWFITQAKHITGVGNAFPSLLAGDLLSVAKRSTGLEDLEDIDGSFVQGLEKLGDALENEANLTSIGRVLAWVQMKVVIENRLNIVEYAKQNPKVLAEEIIAPVFIAGLPRSGTTFLHNLLRQDNDYFRVTTMWEIQDPVPPTDPHLGDSHHSRYWRILWMKLQIYFFKLIAPTVAAVHNVDALNAEECMAIMGRGGRSLVFNTIYKIPSYQDWLMKQNQLSPMLFHKRYLQTLQYGERTRGKSRKTWLLKAPWHMYNLEAIWKVYPDARILMPHRDPAGMIASLSSLHARFYSIVTNDIRPMEIGAYQSSQWQQILDRLLKTRRDHPERSKKIVDIAFQDLIKDPLRTVRNVYKVFGIDLTPETMKGMKSYLNGTAGDGLGKKGKHGKHEYKLEWFGLEESTLVDNPTFTSYCKEYNVPQKYMHSSEYST